MKRRTTLSLLGQAGVASLVAGLLGGCGFKLRGDEQYAFQSLAIMPNPGGGVATELRRTFGDAVHILAPDEPLANAQVIIDITQELREKVVVGINSSGQVREFQIRLRVKFKVRTPQGDELTPETDIVQQRDISFNESAVLAKEAEEALLNRDMQTDIVQQLMRRLARVKPTHAPSP